MLAGPDYSALKSWVMGLYGSKDHLGYSSSTNCSVGHQACNPSNCLAGCPIIRPGVILDIPVGLVPMFLTIAVVAKVKEIIVARDTMSRGVAGHSVDISVARTFWKVLTVSHGATFLLSSLPSGRSNTVDRQHRSSLSPWSCQLNVMIKGPVPALIFPPPPRVADKSCGMNLEAASLFVKSIPLLIHWQVWCFSGFGLSLIFCQKWQWYPRQARRVLLIQHFPPNYFEMSNSDYCSFTEGNTFIEYVNANSSPTADNNNKMEF